MKEKNGTGASIQIHTYKKGTFTAQEPPWRINLTGSALTVIIKGDNNMYNNAEYYEFLVTIVQT